MGRPESLEGRVVTQDQSGGILLEDRLGTYWALESQEILSQSPGNGDFAYASPDELSASLAAAAGTGAAVSKTRRYVLVSQASKAYTNWCGSLLERLQTGFRAHWERDKLPLTESSGPLPVLIFRTRSQFAEYAVRDGAGAVAESFGYYSARTNRIALYDLTAEESGVPLGEAATREEITRGCPAFRPALPRLSTRPLTRSPSTPVCRCDTPTTRCGCRKGWRCTLKHRISHRADGGQRPESPTAGGLRNIASPRHNGRLTP